MPDTSKEKSQNKEANSPENCVLEEYSPIDAIDPKIGLDLEMNVRRSQPVICSDFKADENNNRGDKGRPQTATEIRVDGKESGNIQSATDEEESTFGRTKTVIVGK